MKTEHLLTKNVLVEVALTAKISNNQKNNIYSHGTYSCRPHLLSEFHTQKKTERHLHSRNVFVQIPFTATLEVTRAG